MAYPLAIGVEGTKDSEDLHCLAAERHLLFRLEEVDEQAEQLRVAQVWLDDIACCCDQLAECNKRSLALGGRTLVLEHLNYQGEEQVEELDHVFPCDLGQLAQGSEDTGRHTGAGVLELGKKYFKNGRSVGLDQSLGSSHEVAQ